MVAQGRQPILTREELREALREGIREVRQSLPFIIEAWVLLPDHLHAIWTLPEGDANYGSRWAVIKRMVTRRCCGAFHEREVAAVRETHPTDSRHILSASMQKRREGGLWQRRFWEHTIRDEEDFRRHMDYLHYNPVKHGYVSKVTDWPYSMFHRLVQKGVYPVDWGGDACQDLLSRDIGE